MKNYYKLLGVRKNASEEEIREHWVQLMRKLHPDQRMEGAVEDERIKEINEAYQVLKHSSTRVEYDLKRAYDQEKRGSYFRRVFLPVGIPIILLILAVVYLKSPRVILQPSLTTLNQANQTNQVNLSPLPRSESVQGLSRSESVRGEMQSLFHRDQINPIASTTPKPKPSNVHNDNNVLNALTINASTPPRIDSSTHLPFDLSPFTFDLVIDPSTQRRDDPTNANTQLTQRPNGLIAAVNQTDEINQIDANPQIAQAKMPPLIATEDEIRQFFANYTERYMQKHLDGFLSLFSPRVVQNRQNGLEGIRKIYGNFFEKSQEIEYHIDDIKIEIYQNAAEVKARYELVQLLKKSGEKKIWGGDIRWTLVKEGGALKILSLDYQPQKSY